MSQYQERLDRILAAVALEPVDRISFSYLGTSANAQFTGTSLANYCADMELNCTTNLKGIEMIGEIDSTQAAIFSPHLLPSSWLTEVLVPGEGLAENEPWQMHEKELVSQSDYDEIIEGGFAPWYDRFLKEKLGNPLAKAAPFFGYFGEATARFAQADIPNINAGSFYSPYEMFCGGRSLVAFLTEDLMEMPDKIEKVFQLTQEFNMQNFEAQLKNPMGKPIGVWVGGWRGTPSMLSPDMFERYSWKYMREIIDLVIENGVIPILHLDSNWTSGLEYFLDLPKGKCIMALDGDTDIFKAKEIVDDHMCIMGDVPAAMLAFSQADDVSDYCDKLIRELGPTGFILCSGCDTPYNAKLENVQAMAASVHK